MLRSSKLNPITPNHMPECSVDLGRQRTIGFSRSTYRLLSKSDRAITHCLQLLTTGGTSFLTLADIWSRPTAVTDMAPARFCSTYPK